jgi:hypothetical protein
MKNLETVRKLEGAGSPTGAEAPLLNQSHRTNRWRFGSPGRVQLEARATQWWLAYGRDPVSSR